MFCEMLLSITPESTNNNSSLPSHLEDDNLETILVAYDGSCVDQKKKGRQYLPEQLFLAVSKMTTMQKIFIQEKEKKHRGENRKGVNI